MKTLNWWNLTYIVEKIKAVLLNAELVTGDDQQSEESDAVRKARDVKIGEAKRNQVTAWIFLFAAAVFTILFFVVDPLVIKKETVDAAGVTIEAITFSWTALWFGLVLLYFGLSYRIIDPVSYDERASVLYFEKALYDVSDGALFIPLFIFKLERLTSNLIQRELPGEPRNIYRGDMKSVDVLPKGKVPPIRINFRSSIKDIDMATKFFGDDVVAKRNLGDGKVEKVTFLIETEKDGLDIRVPAEPSLGISFVINEPTIFIRNIGSIDNAIKQIEDEMFRIINLHYPKMSLAQAFQNFEWMNILLRNAVEELVGIQGTLKPWGIGLQNAFVKDIYVSHGLNTSISEASEAMFKKATRITDAEGTKAESILLGAGERSRKRDNELGVIEGITKGLNKQTDLLDISGEVAIAQFGVKKLAEGGNSIIFGSGGGLNELAVVGTELMKRNSENNKSKSEEKKED